MEAAQVAPSSEYGNGITPGSVTLMRAPAGKLGDWREHAEYIRAVPTGGSPALCREPLHRTGKLRTDGIPGYKGVIAGKKPQTCFGGTFKQVALEMHDRQRHDPEPYRNIEWMPVPDAHQSVRKQEEINRNWLRKDYDGEYRKIDYGPGIPGYGGRRPGAERAVDRGVLGKSASLPTIAPPGVTSEDVHGHIGREPQRCLAPGHRLQLPDRIPGYAGHIRGRSTYEPLTTGPSYCGVEPAVQQTHPLARAFERSDGLRTGGGSILGRSWGEQRSATDAAVPGYRRALKLSN